MGLEAIGLEILLAKIKIQFFGKAFLNLDCYFAKYESENLGWQACFFLDG